MEDKLTAIVIIICVSILSLAVGYSIGSVEMTKTMQSKAVYNNCGEWYVTEHNQRKFRWKTQN